LLRQAELALSQAMRIFLVLAPPASHNANYEPVVEGPTITLAARHAKVRREGYAKRM
jgi:hypothetical protein